MLIKVRFTKDDKPVGREYTYRSKTSVEVGDQVELPNGGTGIVTSVDVSEAEVEAYKDKIKEIVGKKLKRPEKLNDFIKACLQKVKGGHATAYEYFCYFDISEQEVDECIEYLESNEGINTNRL